VINGKPPRELLQIIEKVIAKQVRPALSKPITVRGQFTLTRPWE
jgi:hypothetical protein